MAQKHGSTGAIDSKDPIPVNRFDRVGNVFGETLGDYAFDRFQEWAQSVWIGDRWVDTGHPLDPAVVQTEVECLLDIPYLWLRFGNALEVVSTFEDWLIAVISCLSDMLQNPDYQWILKTTDARELRMVAETERWNHPALQRANFERIKIEACIRREEKVREHLSGRATR